MKKERRISRILTNRETNEIMIQLPEICRGNNAHPQTAGESVRVAQAIMHVLFAFARAIKVRK
jgi:hypothetical protein